MMLNEEPPFATAWPSLADATAMVPKATSRRGHHEQTCAR